MSEAEVPEDFGELLVGIHRVVRRRLRQDLAGPRLRGAQVELLRLVGARPGIGVSAAARELHLAGNSVSTLVNQLVAAGLLERRTDPGDRRAVRLTITAEAADRLVDWDARRSALVRRQVAGLTEHDRTALAEAVPALRRLAASLHEELEGE
ncbi:MarR family winged helix-turn-helix transcriptional regulator [Streptacidiphilus sp. P02-A3a]|uniref:MarR family winged helix-turn-helix transcriptional regulator n=1 Tax=Streptacidiphilus sp. P02-A3a TaxID=2704468 RepID=UPI0015FC4FDF|nr:MarR family transcriptional regulator [Streptacidiphilus sp. P02-A3a]QMU68890.1 MarR family transcriptional regulator [Streptacidiphilus sp. P02-A3a]